MWKVGTLAGGPGLTIVFLNFSGRKPVDAIVMFRMLVLQALHNLSDEQAEYQARGRLSFTRFLRLGLEDGIDDVVAVSGETRQGWAH